MIEHRYQIGDAVWRAATTTETVQAPCPDCLGEKTWKVTSPAGTEYEFGCPRCNGTYHAKHDLSLKRTRFAPYAERLTIGSIRTDTASDRPVEYMCIETGVGIGSIYDERTLYPTEEEAFAAAKAAAASDNARTPWVVEQLERVEGVCDYQLSNAAIRDADLRRSQTRTQVLSLLDSLADCETIDEVRSIVESFEWT